MITKQDQKDLEAFIDKAHKRELSNAAELDRLLKLMDTKRFRSLSIKSQLLLKEYADRQKAIEEELASHRRALVIEGIDYEEAYKNTVSRKLVQEELKARMEAAREVAAAMSEYQQKQNKNIGATIAEAQKAFDEAIKKSAEANLPGISEKEAQKLQKEAKKAEDKAKMLSNVAERQSKVDMSKGNPMQEMIKQMKENAKFAKTAEGKKANRDKQLEQTMKAVGSAIKDGLSAINNAIASYAKAQASINARLQGSTTGSYSKIAKELKDVAYSPLLSTEELYDNVGTLVHTGIAQNVAQRAFFQTVKSGIAETFDVNESYMRRIIKIQQNDSTAARLGMESYLTRWLNEYVENTEYLTETFDSVANSLLEASAVIGAGGKTAQSLEFEAVVQNWLGAMTGVGFSNESAQTIASALGQLGSGNLDVLNSETGTLLTMAAAASGKNIGEMLVEGLDAEKTNALLAAAVNFLQTIAADNSNNVTKAEMAKIFGVSMSDLVAISNLKTDEIIKSTQALTYTKMYSELQDQFKDLPGRLGIANILENAFKNFTYQTGMNIAANPVGYFTWKVTDLIQGVTGGINIPTISALGNGIDLETTVENLVKLGIVGVSTIASIPSMVKGVAGVFNGGNLLNAVGAKMENAGYQVKLIGNGSDKKSPAERISGSSLSEYGSIKGNNSGEDIQSATVNDAENAQKQKQKKLMKEAEENDPVLKYLSKTVKLDSLLKGIYIKMGGSLNAGGEIINSEDTGTNVAGVAVNNIEGLLTDIKDILSKPLEVSSAATINTSVVNLITGANNASEILPSLGNDAGSIGGNNIINNVGSTNTVTSKSSDYLSEIQFGDGFKQLVTDVADIKNKIVNQSSSTPTIAEPEAIESFNTGSFRQQNSVIL